jgi:hypothetical protein
MDRGSDLRADRFRGQINTGHADHVFEPGQRLARRVRMDRAHGPVVAGVHRLQHVESLGAADLAEDDPVGAHTQGVAQQVAHRDLATAFEVRRPSFQPHDMRLLQLQFGRVLDRHGPFSRVDQPRQRIQQRRLARTGASGDQDVQAAARGDL